MRLIGRCFRLRLLPLHQLDVQAKRLQFAHQDVERFGHARLDTGLAKLMRIESKSAIWLARS